MMEAKWTGKTDEKGPHFSITNKSPTAILYGKITVYFYDKAGNQLSVATDGGKPRPFITCAGNIFGGIMKKDEKAVLTFSCVKKEHLPEGTTAIEAELPMVGFADPKDEKKSEFFWLNEDLAQDVRRKGGLK